MRNFIFAAFAALAFTSPAVAAPQSAGSATFDVLRNGQPFGRHTVSVTRSGDGFAVQSNVSLRVGAGPVTLYRYTQACSETWNANTLTGLRCSTLKEGQRTQVSAARSGDTLDVTGGPGARDFPLGAWPTTWWTRPPANVSSMLNTETGAPMNVRVTDLGVESFDAGGTHIQAHRIRVQGTLTVDLWYDDSGRWVGCEFTARGQRVTYRLTSPRASAPA